MDAREFLSLYNKVNHPSSRDICKLGLRIITILENMSDEIKKAGGDIPAEQLAKMSVIDFLDVCVRNNLKVQVLFQNPQKMEELKAQFLACDKEE